MIGKNVSHYRITRELGSGGMGVVYEAVDTKLDRTVALKFLPPESTRDPDAKARFIHEAKAASALDHPNVCTIHEIDETDDGRLFLAMARYEGATLKERISGCPLPLDQALDITNQVAEGLQEAHVRDIVHRDIKPANIFLTEGGLVKILDFGLAKLAGLTRLTREGTTMGTGQYMSPEQAAGRETDHRTDLWSLGVVLYEMVTGRVPFGGDHLQAVMYAIQNTEPEPVTGLRTGVPLELERIIGKCLAKDPAVRYQHADDLLAELRGLGQDTRGSSPAILSAGAIERKPPRRWPWAIGVAAALVVGGAAALLLFGSGGETPLGDLENTLAIVDFRDIEAPDDVLASAGVIELMNISLVENSPIRVISPEYLRDVRRRLYGSGRGHIEDDQVIEVAREAGATLFLAGRIGRTGQGRFVTWRLVDTRSGNSLEASKVDGGNLTEIVDRIAAAVVPVVEVACGIEQVRAAVSPVENVSTASPEAYEHYLAGVVEMERFEGERAKNEFERAIAIDPGFALAYLELGKLFWGSIAEFRDAGRAMAMLEEADRLRDRLGQKDQLRLDAALLDNRREFSRAETTYEALLARWPDDYRGIYDLMMLRMRYWDHAGALRVARQGLGYYPDDGGIFGSMEINMLLCLSRYREGLTKALEQVDQHRNNANLWDDLAHAWLATGRPDSASVAVWKAMELEPDWNYEVLRSQIAYASGDLQEAITITRRYLDDDQLPDSARRWQMLVSSVRIGLSALHCEAGQHQRAVEVAEEAGTYSLGDPSGTAHGKGKILLRAGKPAEALEIAHALSREHDDVRAPFYSLRLRAHAAVALGDLPAAKEAVRGILGAQGEYGFMAKAIALLVQAKIALVEHRPEAALEALDALQEQGITPFGLFQVEVLTARAEAHALAGRLDEAVAVHEELLRVYGGHALSHYALGGLYEELGRQEEAASAYEAFLEMWSEADEGLPQLIEARMRLKALTEDSTN